MASGMNFAYYVLYRFWINPPSHKSLIGTIELHRGQRKIWKQVWIFFPVAEPWIHISLHIHLAGQKGNSLTAFFQPSLLLHSRNIILLPILFLHRSENSKTLQVPFLCGPGMDCRERINSNKLKRELIVEEVMFSILLFHLLYELTSSDCIITDHVFSVGT